MYVQHKDQKKKKYAMFKNRTEQSAGNSLIAKIKDIWSLLCNNNNNNGKNNKDVNHKNRFVWSIHFDAIESQVLRVCFSNDLSHICIYSQFFLRKIFHHTVNGDIIFLSFSFAKRNETIHLQTLFNFFSFVFFSSMLQSWANVWTKIAYCNKSKCNKRECLLWSNIFRLIKGVSSRAYKMIAMWW